MILVSACLLGENCKYSGGNNYCQAVVDYLKNKEYLPFCPEAAGGLPIPRPPCERRGQQVVSKDGRDETEAFYQGAQQGLALCQKHGIKLAILKESSPSCGSSLIYDGSFGNRKIPGEGVTAALFRQHGIEVLSEEDVKRILT